MKIWVHIYIYRLIASEIINKKWGTFFFTIMKNTLKMHFTPVV